MRRLLPILALALPFVAGAALACSTPDAHVSGTFDDQGRFVLDSALTAGGKNIDRVKGLVLTSVTAADGVTLAAADLAGKTVWAVGDVNWDHNSLVVKSWTDDAAVASATVASIQGAGSHCSSTKGASAKVASSGASCGSKASAATAGAKVASSGASCGSKASAATAGAKVAGSGASCGSKASAATADAKVASEKCGAECAKACCAAATTITYTVSGMTCGGCASKIESAVAALEMEGIEACAVDYEKGTAVITTNSPVCQKTIQKAITGAGFPADIVQADTEADEGAEG